MPSDGWIKKLEDGGRVEIHLPGSAGEVAFITAQVEGNKVVYSIRINQRQEPDQS
jgi:acylphosphatase